MPSMHKDGVEVHLYSFLTSALDRGGSSTPRLVPLKPGKGLRYPFYRRRFHCTLL